MGCAEYESPVHMCNSAKMTEEFFSCQAVGSRRRMANFVPINIRLRLRVSWTDGVGVSYIAQFVFLCYAFLFISYMNWLESAIVLFIPSISNATIARMAKGVKERCPCR